METEGEDDEQDEQESVEDDDDELSDEELQERWGDEVPSDSDEEEENEEGSVNEDQEGERRIVPSGERKTEEPTTQADDLRNVLQKTREEDMRKGKALVRQLVSRWLMVSFCTLKKYLEYMGFPS